jgi:hypothetical protein
VDADLNDLAGPAIDPEQQAFAERKAQQRIARRRELWRWLMGQKLGRELLYDVLLPELGFLRAIRGSVDQVWGDVALYNLCCRLMAEDILVHPELYLQMQTEAGKRDKAERDELEAARVKWATRDNAA